MEALIFEGVVLQVQETQFDVRPEFQWVSCDDTVQSGWTYMNGTFASPIAILPNPNEILATYKFAIQNALDSVAQGRQFDDGTTCATFVASTNQKWQAEAVTFIAWRDSVYAYVNPIFTQIQAGQNVPPIQQVIAGMPVIVWPPST